MIDAAGHTTTYGYDAVGHSTGRTDADGGSLVWTYDPMGNRTAQRNRTDPVLTASVAWTHDPAGRILTRVADSITTGYTYDVNGNQLTASASGMTITSGYDRLNRVIAVDDEDAGTTADTTTTYSLASPTWTDPTGTYTASLDRFDRATTVHTPANAANANFTWTYGTGGQPLTMTSPNTNVTTYAYDRAGHELDRETKTGSTSRAHYTWAYNQAGQILSEAATVTGDPANGTVAYGYDKLGQLTASGLLGTTTAYGWDAVTNRTSVKVGAGTPATTEYDAANRPTSGANPTATYASDADGRLTARPGQTMTWDHLGRLTAVKDASGTTTIASYSYDPLDRLRIADDGAAGRTRFRYTGSTTSVAQWIDDTTGSVTRCVGNGWTGERLLDWTGAGVDPRYYGTNAHHDVTWLADATGAGTSRLRYDPWGTPRSAVPAGYTPFRFQSSWHDDTVNLVWVVTRWYAPSLGRFISEDTLLGKSREPDSRHLYAYAAGEPVGSWDPWGRAGLTFGDQFGGWFAGGLHVFTRNYGKTPRDRVNSLDASVGVDIGGNIIGPGLPVPAVGATSFTVYRQSQGFSSHLLPNRRQTLRVGIDASVNTSKEGWLLEARSSHRYKLIIDVYRVRGAFRHWSKATSVSAWTECVSVALPTEIGVISAAGCKPGGFNLSETVSLAKDFTITPAIGDRYRVMVRVDGGVTIAGLWGYAETHAHVQQIRGTYKWLYH